MLSLDLQLGALQEHFLQVRFDGHSSSWDGNRAAGFKLL